MHLYHRILVSKTVSDSEIQLENYNLCGRDRNRHGGGVCIYVRSDLVFNPIDELSHEDLEATWIELLLPKTKPIVCGVIYRPPHQTNLYDVLEDEYLKNSYLNERECYILGDFNTNVKGNRKRTLLKSLSSYLDLFNLIEIIKDFTRVSENSSSTIDPILCQIQKRFPNQELLILG